MFKLVSRTSSPTDPFVEVRLPRSHMSDSALAFAGMLVAAGDTPESKDAIAAYQDTIRSYQTRIAEILTLVTPFETAIPGFLNQIKDLAKDMVPTWDPALPAYSHDVIDWMHTTAVVNIQLLGLHEFVLGQIVGYVHGLAQDNQEQADTIVQLEAKIAGLQLEATVRVSGSHQHPRGKLAPLTVKTGPPEVPQDPQAAIALQLAGLQGFKADNEQLRAENARLQAENARLQAENVRLQPKTEQGLSSSSSNLSNASKICVVS